MKFTNLLSAAVLAGLMSLPLVASAQDRHRDNDKKSNQGRPSDNRRGNDKRNNDRQSNDRWNDNRRNDKDRWDRNNGHDNGRHNGWDKNDRRDNDWDRRNSNDRWDNDRNRRNDDHWDDNRRVIIRQPNYGNRDNDYYRREETKHEWRNLATLGGLISVIGLLNHDDTLFFAGAAGSLYSEYRYSQDQRSQDRMCRARAYYFSQPYFYRDGCRYERRSVNRGGDRYYQFVRCD